MNAEQGAELAVQLQNTSLKSVLTILWREEMLARAQVRREQNGGVLTVREFNYLNDEMSDWLQQAVQYLTDVHNSAEGLETLPHRVHTLVQEVLLETVAKEKRKCQQ